MPNHFSKLRGAIWRGAWRSVSGKETRIQDQVVDILIGQGKLLLGQSRLLHILPSGAFADLHVFIRPGTIAAAQANLHSANQRKSLSVVGAFCRSISLPSVSGCHVDCLLSEPNQVLGINSQKGLMAACGSRSAFTDRSISNLTCIPGQRGAAAYHSSSAHIINSFENVGKFTMSLSSKDEPNNFLLYGYFVYNVVKRKGNENPLLGVGFEGFHNISPSYSSASTAADVTFDNPIKEEQHSNSADSSNLNIPIDRTLKLKSGSCYLPHPDKEETGGEDAHFICIDEQAIGVADGVGGWADLGVDAGKYARELMSNSVYAIQEEPRGSIDPARVLEKAHTKTKAKGSSTACIIALTNQGLHAINLGDSGFMVIRNGCTVFRSPIQQHDFNFTYQLESGNAGDLPSSGQVR